MNVMYLTQLVYVNPGKETAFHAFENVAIPLMSKHGGQLLLRVRPTPGCIVAAEIEVPYELHVVRFNSGQDFEAFSEDPARQRVLHLKNESVRSATLIRGTT